MHTYTVEDAIEHIGVGRFHHKLAAITGLTWISDSVEVMVLAILGPVLLCEWHLYRYQEALISTILFVGFMIGCPVFGTISDIYGRKAAVMLANAWVLYFGVLSAFSPLYIMLVLLRGLAGIGLGGISQSLALASEFTPKSYRGKYMMILAVGWCLGGILAVIFGLLVLQPFGWRPWLVTCALPSLTLFLVAWFWMPESARFQVGSGQYKSALDTIHRIAKENGKEPPVGKLVPEPQVGRGRVQDLLAPSVRRITIPVWIMWFCIIFTYYGQVLLTTELVNHEGATCDGNAMSDSQTSDCPVSCKPITKDVYIVLLWTSSAEIPGVLANIFLVEFLGRKKTSVTWFTIVTFTFILLCFCPSRVLMLLLLIIGRTALAAQVQVTYLLTVEVYPTSVRGIGLAAGGVWGRVGAILCPFVSNVLMNVSLSFGLATYAFASLVGAVVACVLPYETQGRALKMGLHDD